MFIQKFIQTLCLVLGLSGGVTFGQGELTFSKDSMLVEVNSFESNLVKMKVEEGGIYNLHMDIPKAVQLISSVDSVWELTADRIKPLVLRFKVGTEFEASFPQQVCFYLTKGEVLIKGCFTLEALPLYKIVPQVVHKEVKIFEEDNYGYSQLRIRNDGNVGDTVWVSAEIRKPLVGKDDYKIYLPPGKDTTFTIDLTVESQVEQELPDIRYTISSSSPKVLLVQDLFYVRNSYTPNSNRNHVLPVQVNSIGQVINGSNLIISTAVSGRIPVYEDHRIGYQWFGIGNLGKDGLQTNQWSVEWGGNRHYIKYGRLQYMGLVGQNDLGLESQYRLKRGLVRFNFMRSPVNEQQQVGLVVQDNRENWNMRYNYQQHQQPELGISNYLIGASAGYTFEKDLSIRNELSIGRVTNPFFNTTTFQYQGRAFYSQRGYVLQGGLILTSPDHPTYNRGENSLVLDVQKTKSSKALGFSLNYTRIKARLVTQENVRDLPVLVRGLMQVYARNRGDQGLVQIGFGAEHQVFRGLETWYVRPEVRWNMDLPNIGKLNQLFNIGLVYYTATGNRAYRHEIRQQLYVGSSQFIVRYVEGPQDYYEQLLFSNDGRRTGISQVRAQHSFLIFENGGRISGFAEYTHQHISGFKRKTIGASTRWKLWKSGDLLIRDQWSFGGAASVHIAMFQLNMGLEAPVPFTVAHPRLTVRFAMDRNANGLLDDDDEPVIGQFVSIDGRWLITDEYGMVKANNLGRGEHFVDLGQIKERGWQVVGDNFRTVVIQDDFELTILLNKTKVIEGKILVGRDRHSKWFFDLDYIRVEAISKTGEVYTALTQEDGSFALNVPEGEYTVRFNTKVFSPKYFKVDHGQETVDLRKNDHVRVEFKVSEKKRRIILGN